ncbi:hypothetical protein JAAARDRAFT_211186 [Jaapia argillacea MUCL 33604]|uniref:Uncharacterized protein n=1 Tax=Jaapia argillacea MUCL 33604 TaxID=933084 RepID=A0A067P8H7_9AGAM|nr:hypothetical protein JAAARDRAFT_211186 [Jaapia argillacea MUCL 33604]
MSTGAFFIHPTNGVRLFLQHAQLPTFRLDPLTQLAPPVERRRTRDSILFKLRSSQTLKVLPRDQFDHRVSTFLDAYIPSDLRADVLDAGQVSISTHKVKEMFLNYPLKTALKVMNLSTNVSSYSWSGSEDVEENELESLLFARTNQPTGIAATAPLVVIYQSRLILTDREIDSFVGCAKRRMLSPTATTAQKLWSKITQICEGKKSPFFVLTNYDSWVFGAFSPDRQCAVATGRKQWDATQTSVLECLLYWMASATGAPSGFVFPEKKEFSNLPTIAEPPSSLENNPSQVGDQSVMKMPEPWSHLPAQTVNSNAPPQDRVNPMPGFRFETNEVDLEDGTFSTDECPISTVSVPEPGAVAFPQPWFPDEGPPHYENPQETEPPLPPQYRSRETSPTLDSHPTPSSQPDSRRPARSPPLRFSDMPPFFDVWNDDFGLLIE